MFTDANLSPHQSRHIFFRSFYFSISFVAQLKLFKHIFGINKIRFIYLNSVFATCCVVRTHIQSTHSLNMYECVTIADMTKILIPSSLNRANSFHCFRSLPNISRQPNLLQMRTDLPLVHAFYKINHMVWRLFWHCSSLVCLDNC